MPPAAVERMQPRVGGCSWRLAIVVTFAIAGCKPLPEGLPRERVQVTALFAKRASEVHDALGSPAFSARLRDGWCAGTVELYRLQSARGHAASLSVVYDDTEASAGRVVEIQIHGARVGDQLAGVRAWFSVPSDDRVNGVTLLVSRIDTDAALLASIRPAELSVLDSREKNRKLFGDAGPSEVQLRSDARQRILRDFGAAALADTVLYSEGADIFDGTEATGSVEVASPYLARGLTIYVTYRKTARGGWERIGDDTLVHDSETEQAMREWMSLQK